MTNHTRAILTLTLIALALPGLASAFSSGVSSISFPDPVTGCNNAACHKGGVAPSVTLTGPTSVLPSSVNEYTLEIFEVGSQDHGGLNVAAPAGVFSVGGANSAMTKILLGDITHTTRKPMAGGSVLFSFLWEAPASNGPVTLRGWGNAVDANFNFLGDLASVAELEVDVSDGGGGLTPIHFMEYKIKETDKKAVNGALAKGCNVTLDDPIFDFDDGESTAENYAVFKAKSLGLPADKNGEGGVDLNGTHLLGLQAKPSKAGALPVSDGKFPKGRKHVKRTNVEVTISNPTFHDGSGSNTVRLSTTKTTRLLVPANKDLFGTPAPPSDTTDHYKCYKVGTTKEGPFGTLQDSKGKLLKNLQVVVEDQFEDNAGHPQFGDARLMTLTKVMELCNPVSKANIDTTEQNGKGETRTSTCTVAPAAVNDPSTSLLCFAAKVASKEIPQPWDGVDKGTKIDPKQFKHEKLGFVGVGHQFTAPDTVDTVKDLHFCMPVAVTDPGAPAS